MRKQRAIYFWLVILVITMIVVLSTGYSYWNGASPEKTCASCHEIVTSVHRLAESSHRNLKCSDCHGTALSNGFHSLKEKGMMVVNHIIDERVEDIRLNEEQLLAVQISCSKCHADEFSKWKSGGHSVDYKHIFLNTNHNRREQINFDCLRCHGMFNTGSVEDIVEPIDTKGPWRLKNEKLSTRPAIPCMACHMIHRAGSVAGMPDYANPKANFYLQDQESNGITFYDRHERSYYADEDLPVIKMLHDGMPVKISEDPVMRNCIQCHAPGGHHISGTSDDRTPRGVHEGLSCTACHDAHSNSSRESCSGCHPLYSNCGLDVTKMNTTYADSNSVNNIHFVRCIDCHEEKEKRINN